MYSPLQPLVEQLKAARERKGLSQRDLGERVGLPQSHISKIENGTVDLQTSNLIEIARALDLELTLLPRSALPAVRAIQDSQRQETTRTVPEVDRNLRLLRNRAGKLAARHPQAKALGQLVRTATEMQQVPTTPSGSELRRLTDTLNDIFRQLRQLASADRNKLATAPLIREIELSSERLTKLRNAAAQGVTDRQTKPQPAYRLDDDGGSDG